MPDTIFPPTLGTATYTVAQLAAALQCSPRHLWRLIDLGRVPGVLRVGRLVRIARAVADAWIAGGCRAVPAEGEARDAS
jgi:excisionase family DNA binding protein